MNNMLGAVYFTTDYFNVQICNDMMKKKILILYDESKI